MTGGSKSFTWLTRVFRSSTRSCSTCLRLKASRRRVSDAARSVHFKNFVQFPAQRAVRPDAIQRKGRVTANDHQKVVEVMGDAASQATDGLHFLRFPQRLLGMFANGDFLLQFLVAGSHFPGMRARGFRQIHGEGHYAGHQNSADERKAGQQRKRVRAGFRFGPYLDSPVQLLKMDIRELSPVRIARCQDGAGTVDLLVAVVNRYPIALAPRFAEWRESDPR